MTTAIVTGSAELIERIFADRGKDITPVVHAPAQSSHDCAPRDPRLDFRIGGEVYTTDGGRVSNRSRFETCERIAGRRLEWRYQPTNHIGDDNWYMSDAERWQAGPA
jgi:hypothetical protein